MCWFSKEAINPLPAILRPIYGAYSAKFGFQFMEESPKEIPMSVATMSR